jgi:AhpD family alkylhydroperoxidase
MHLLKRFHRGRRAFFKVIKYINTVKPGSAEGLVAEVYAQIKRDFGRVVEPFILHSPLPKLLAAAWMACRETELVGCVPRELKEAVAAAVSNLNQCPYCVDAHTIMLDAAGERKAAEAISSQCYGEIPEGKMWLMVEWASATYNPKSEVILKPPFSRQEAPEVIGTAVFYHYVNRMVTVLLGSTPLPSNQRWLKGSMKKVAGWMFSDALHRTKTVGDALHFLPKADLPNDLHWAKKAPHIAWAYARFAATIDQVGEYALSSEVRAHVQEEISEWNGKTSELGLAWNEDAISRFDEATQDAARLALLTALAPYRVDKSVVSAFRRHFPGDAKLVGALAWASFTAARKIGAWLQAPST